jgi:L-rhamnose mutarotase
VCDVTLKRYASVIRLRPEHEAEYRRLHAEAWPEIYDNICAAGIRNYSIFYRDGLLFSYFEYDGDYDADQARMEPNDVARRWWALTEPCVEPVETAAPGQLWAPAEEVFHAD